MFHDILSPSLSSSRFLMSRKTSDTKIESNRGDILSSPKINIQKFESINDFHNQYKFDEERHDW